MHYESLPLTPYPSQAQGGISKKHFPPSCRGSQRRPDHSRKSV
jgi:hypothetical protein